MAQIVALAYLITASYETYHKGINGDKGRDEHHGEKQLQPVGKAHVVTAAMAYQRVKGIAEIEKEKQQ